MIKEAEGSLQVWYNPKRNKVYLIGCMFPGEFIEIPGDYIFEELHNRDSIYIGEFY
jgi:hypothetical protein